MNSHPRKSGHSLVQTLLCSAAIGCAAAAGMYLWLQHRLLPSVPSKEPETYGVLLGCPSHSDGTLSGSQLKRCHLAIKAWDECLYQTLVITGGAVRNRYTECRAMADYIRFFRNIPIVEEDQARSTWQNFEKTRELIGDQPILVLTSSLHARRACAIARQFFDTVSVMTYPDWKPKHMARELASRLVYMGMELKKGRLQAPDRTGTEKDASSAAEA